MEDDKKEVVQEAIDAINKVLKVYENHIYRSDIEDLMKAKGALMLMQKPHGLLNWR